MVALRDDANDPHLSNISWKTLACSAYLQVLLVRVRLNDAGG